MEWQQMIGFYNTARLGSFTRAAEATFRTQSALSQQVKSLEAELGCRLFDRIGRRRLRLTPAGEKVLEFARNVLEGRDRLLVEIGELKGLHVGRLRLGAPFTTLYRFLPRAVEKYAKVFPKVELNLVDSTPQAIIDQVRSGDLDLGVVMESVAPKDLAVHRWRRTESVLLVPEEHPLKAASRPSLHEIVQYPLILEHKNLKYSSRLLLEERLADQGLTYRLALESSSLVLSLVYVELGLGAAFANMVHDPDLLAGRRVRVIGLDHLFPADHLCLVTRPDPEPGSYFSAFVEMLLTEHGDR